MFVIKWRRKFLTHENSFREKRFARIFLSRILANEILATLENNQEMEILELCDF